MKKITLSLLLCLICLSGMAQSSKKLDLKDITSGKYRAENIRNVVPMPDGEHYTQMNEEGTQITKYSFKTGEPVEVIFDVTKAGNVISRISMVTSFHRTGKSCLSQPKQRPFTGVHIQPCIIYTP